MESLAETFLSLDDMEYFQRLSPDGRVPCKLMAWEKSFSLFRDEQIVRSYMKM